MLVLLVGTVGVGGGYVRHQMLPAQDAKQAEAPKPVAAPRRGTGDRIKPGDRLVVDVMNALPDRPINGVFRVEAQGTINLGVPYGRVRVDGQSLGAAEKVIWHRLDGLLLKDPRVSVSFYDGGADDRVSSLERRVQQLEKEVRTLKEAVERLEKRRR